MLIFVESAVDSLRECRCRKGSKQEADNQADRVHLPSSTIKDLRLPEGCPSAGSCAPVLPYLSDLSLELVQEIIGCPSDNFIANQEHRRALETEFLREFFGLIERFLDVGVLR